MLEDLTEGFKTDTIETEGDELVININEAAHNISWLPPGQRLLTVARGIEPHQLPAPIICLTVLIISNTITRYNETIFVIIKNESFILLAHVKLSLVKVTSFTIS